MKIVSLAPVVQRIHKVNLSSSGLSQLLQSNVVEIKFTRRHAVAKRPTTRRMLASLNSAILDSEQGRTILNFKPPTRNPAYNASNYNLITVFDIFMQDWRAIPLDTTEVIRVLPSNPPSDFWEYFYTVLVKMTASQKAVFMDQ